MPVSRYACIGLVSAAALLFQVAQTRLFSSSYGYRLTYLVISVSLLGVGSGATLSGVFDRRSRRPSLTALALAGAASALAALSPETHIDPGVALPAAILVAYVAGALPFVFASWIVVRSLREAPSRAGRLYSVDLAGAAAGSLFAFAALPSLGAPGLYRVSACLSALAGVVIPGRRLRRPDRSSRGHHRGAVRAVVAAARSDHRSGGRHRHPECARSRRLPGRRRRGESRGVEPDAWPAVRLQRACVLRSARERRRGRSPELHQALAGPVRPHSDDRRRQLRRPRERGVRALRELPVHRRGLPRLPRSHR